MTFIILIQIFLAIVVITSGIIFYFSGRWPNHPTAQVGYARSKPMWAFRKSALFLNDKESKEDYSLWYAQFISYTYIISATILCIATIVLITSLIRPIALLPIILIASGVGYFYVQEQRLMLDGTSEILACQEKRSGYRPFISPYGINPGGVNPKMYFLKKWFTLESLNANSFSPIEPDYSPKTSIRLKYLGHYEALNLIAKSNLSKELKNSLRSIIAKDEETTLKLTIDFLQPSVPLNLLGIQDLIVHLMKIDAQDFDIIYHSFEVKVANSLSAHNRLAYFACRNNYRNSYDNDYLSRGPLHSINSYQLARPIFKEIEKLFKDDSSLHSINPWLVSSAPELGDGFNEIIHQIGWESKNNKGAYESLTKYGVEARVNFSKMRINASEKEFSNTEVKAYYFEKLNHRFGHLQSRELPWSALEINDIVMRFRDHRIKRLLVDVLVKKMLQQD